MFGCLRKLVGQVVLLLALIAAAYAGWRWGPVVFPKVQEWVGVASAPAPEGPAPTPELADSVLARVQEFRRSGQGQLSLGGREITSVIRYAVPGLIPEGIRDPEVTLGEGRVYLTARVVLSAFPRLPDLGPVLGILPDTLNVVLEGSLLPFGEEESALLVHGVDAAMIPIPRRLIPEILNAMGRQDRPGLPPEAMAVPLPSGVASAYTLTDSLIISSRP